MHVRLTRRGESLIVICPPYIFYLVCQLKKPGNCDHKIFKNFQIQIYMFQKLKGMSNNSLIEFLLVAIKAFKMF